MKQSPNTGRIPNEQIQVLTTYFTALREEMVERVRLVTRTEVGKMVVVVGAIGFAIGKEVRPPDNIEGAALFFFLPLLAALFDMYVSYHQKMLHTMGIYIHDHIEAPLKTLLGDDLTFWEHYVSSSKQYRWDVAGRFVHLGMTLIVVIVCGIFLFGQTGTASQICLKSFYVVFYIGILIGDFFFLGIPQKLRGQYYA